MHWTMSESVDDDTDLFAAVAQSWTPFYPKGQITFNGVLLIQIQEGRLARQLDVRIGAGGRGVRRRRGSGQFDAFSPTVDN